MFEEFKNKYLGKKVDIDGLYGGQCVDLFNAWNRDYNKVYINCQPSGYARSIAENKANNGILKYFKETAINNMITGTVVVYGKCKFAPVGHVCFFIKDNGNGTYQALQQNDKNREYVTIDNNPYDGIIGAFIPNQLLNNSNNNNANKAADQILYPGSKVKFDGAFKVDILKSPISTNLFGCCQLTGCNISDYQNEKVKSYHWLPLNDFTEVDSNGNTKGQDDIITGGSSYVINNNIYEVKEIDIKTNSAKLNINGRDVWVFSTYLYEVSNN